MKSYRFDLNSWFSDHKRLQSDADRWTGDVIDRPASLLHMLQERQRLIKAGVEFREPKLCDIALYGFGQPEHPRVTHISGAAWMPQNAKWPSDRNGDPAMFLGQIFLGDSIDILGHNLPGTTLQIFSTLGPDGYGEYWDNEDRILVWRNEQELLRGNWVRHPTGRSPSAPLTCYMYRTCDYKRVVSDNQDDQDAAISVSELDGTKIGGIAHWIQSTHEDYGAGDTFVCSLGSMYHISEGTQDVFVNEPELDISKLYQAGGSPCWGDMGLINVMRRPNGKLYSTFECS